MKNWHPFIKGLVVIGVLAFSVEIFAGQVLVGYRNWRIAEVKYRDSVASVQRIEVGKKFKRQARLPKIPKP